MNVGSKQPPRNPAKISRKERGTILVLAAVLLALGAYFLMLSLDASQKYLAWKMARAHTEAAALVGALALDGTEAGLEQARLEAATTAGAEPGRVQVTVAPEGNALRVSMAGVTSGARQTELSEPDATPTLTLAAPAAGDVGFGLVKGRSYWAIGTDELGAVVAVKVHSGFPKELPLTWIAGRVVASKVGRTQIEYLGGYLRGARHAATAPYGYFEVTLGSTWIKEGGR